MKYKDPKIVTVRFRIKNRWSKAEKRDYLDRTEAPIDLPPYRHNNTQQARTTP